MDTKDSPSIFTMSTSLFSVAGAVTGISNTWSTYTAKIGAEGVLLDREIFLLEPLASMEGG